MNGNPNTEKRNKIIIALLPSLLMCGFALVTLFKSIESGPTWRIILAATGFAGMLFLTIAVFARLMKFQKETKGESLKS